MSRYQIWDKVSDIYTPSGAHFSADEWADRYSWIKIPGSKMIITAPPINGGVVLEWNATISQYKRLGAAITDDMTEEQVLDAIEDFENNPPGSDKPSIEERTAAALEFIALSNIPNQNI